jgi:broad specificity phosphatase PhoE
VKRIVFLRHPQTAYNVEPVRLRGDKDVPLSSEGFRSIPDIVTAIKTQYPDVKQMYSSPLERCTILATTIAHEYSGVEVKKLDGLKSRGYGVLNGRVVTDVMNVLTTLATGAGRDLAPKNGESMNAFLERLTDVIKTIIYDAPEEGVVVVCTHFLCITAGTTWLHAGLPEDISELEILFREDGEIPPPGGWIEVRRDWVKVKYDTRSVNSK